MKNFLLKFSLILLFVTTLSSCDEDVVIWDNVNGASITSLRSSALELPVSDVGESFVDVIVDVTTVSDVDRAIAINVEANTTATSAMYSIDQATLVVPAGSYNGVVRVNAGAFTAIPEGQTVKLFLTLTSVSGAELVVAKSKVTVNIYRGCALDAGFLVGDYLLEEITPLVDGPTLESGAIRTISIDPANKFNRRFTTYTFPNYCASNRVTFTFSLICNSVIIPAGNVGNCVCTQGAPYVFGAPVTNGSYDSTDDSVVFVTFANDVTGNCGPVVQTTYKLTKQ
jgi:hypothetical protein